MLPKSIRKLLTLIVAVIVGLLLLRLMEPQPRVGWGTVDPGPLAAGPAMVS